MKSSKELKFVYVLNALIIMMELFGLTLTIINQKSLCLQYYTIDSNILALISSVLVLINYKKKKIPKYVNILKYTSTVLLLITFLVVIFVLAPVENNYQQWLLEGEMLFHHLLCPILAFISFVFVEKKIKLDKKDIKYPVIASLIYSIILIILNYAHVVSGPYSFLRFNYHSFSNNLITTICFVILFIITSVLVYELKKKRNKK